MREGWKVAKLEDVAKVVNGGTPKTKVPEYWGGEHLWITPAEMGGLESPYIESSRRSLTDAGLKNSSASLLPRNSVILSTRAPIGHLVINAEPMAFNQGCRGLIPRGEAHYKYLYYFLYSSVNLLNDLGSGTTFKELSAGKLKKVEVPLPPLPEQKRIVAILDEAFAGIATAVANTEKNLANARELFESYLNAVFSRRGEGWAARRLDEVCGISSKLVDPRAPQYRGMRHVGAGNIVSMTGELIDVQTAEQEGLKSGKFLFDESMVLYSKIRPYLMKAARPTFSGLCSADIYPLEPYPGLMSKDFLYYLLLSKSFTDFAIAGSARAGMPKVNREHLFSYKAAVPGIERQKALAQELDSVANETSKLESIARQKLESLTELKNSLIKKAFSGELTAGKAASDAMRQVEEIA